MSKSYCVLGIDLGTTSVKVCLVDSKTQEVLASQKKDTYSDVPSELGSDGNKQDVARILSAVQLCISRLPRDQLRKVKKVATCGQMHGCMMWKQGDAWFQKPDSDRYETKNVSYLYTWQDNRCSPEFLSSLPTPRSHQPLATGYGCATLLWFSKYRPLELSKYDRAGTIHDFFVAMLCGLEHPVMSVQNAAAWGYFDAAAKTWNTDILSAAGLPLELLPTVVESGEVAGELTSNWYAIPKGTPVIASLGDLQCSVLPLLSAPDIAVVNISTSAQISFRLPESFVPPTKPPTSPQTTECVPFMEGRYLSVAASLNGGNALAAFVRTLQQWALDLGCQVPQSKIWERTLTLGAACCEEPEPASTSSDAPADKDSPCSDHMAGGTRGRETLMVITPTVFGERHSPEVNGSASNIRCGNLKLGQVMRALCKGIVANLHSMMPRSVLLDAGVTRIVGGGSALTRNPLLLQELQALYDLPVTLDSRGDAAIGAAIAAIRSDGDVATAAIRSDGDEKSK
ncbi:sedoheptulokinase [Hyalella azteca]|uniref:Sedoheptulokinase n=1 Tax=Hyalella azteca TaxID=294128 RepID=A0A8B7N5I1_HYAAZ|nr:sedoheptulokinase [Hyalella azteca]